MRFKKQLITLLGAVLLGSNLNVSTVVAADAAVDSNTTTTTTTEPEKRHTNGLTHSRLVTSTVYVQCPKCKLSG